MFEKIRTYMEQNPMVGLIAAGVVFFFSILIAGCTLCSWTGGPGNNAPVQTYYFDTVEKKLFADQAGKIAPFKNDKGNESVEAWVYSCDGCQDDKTQYIGYLRKYSDQGKQMLENAMTEGRPAEYDQAEMQVMVSNDEGATWYYLGTEQGIEIQESYNKKCVDEGKTATRCRP